MADHGTRDHATWSASATARNVHCPGALALTRYAPEKPSIHADTGTAVHQIAEKCLRTNVDADTFVGTVEATKAHKIEITEELANSAQEYVDYCRALRETATATWIEERFSFADLNPPFDAGGTGDFVAYVADTGLLEVVDLKNGMGVVDPRDNPQLRSYGLGALLKHSSLNVDQIKVTIVQPRAPHKDGRIRSEAFHVADLIDWTADLLKAMHRSRAAIEAFDATNGNTVLLDEWSAAWLRPGKCTFCPVEGSCPAYKRDALAVAAVWFDDMDQPRLGNAALDQSPEALNRDLNMLPMLEDWIKARRAFAHALAEQGVQFEDFQLVDKIGNRKWNDDGEAVTALMGAGLTDDQVYTRKPVSPAQAEKLLGAKRKSLIEPFVVREVTGTNLVSKSKTTRAPAATAGERFFEPQS